MNKPIHYRAGIYNLIESSFNCDWYFGHCPDKMDTAHFKNCTFVEFKGKRTGLYYQKGVVGLAFDRKYDVYITIGEFKLISSWLLALCVKLFHHQAKLYFWTHGFYGDEGRIKRFVKMLYFSLCDGVFTYGDYARDLMVNHGMDANKIYPIHNSLNYDVQRAIRENLSVSGIYRMHFGNEYPCLLFIGRLTPVKKLDQLVSALDLLKKGGTDCNLIFVGDGSQRHELEKMVDLLSLSDRVWFYGECFDEEQNAVLIYNADVCVSPGNVGLTAIHCLTYGTPVITHNLFCKQMPEFEVVKPGVTGTFFEYGNIEDLAQTISKWIAENGAKRNEIRKACYEVIDSGWTPSYQLNVIKNVS